MSRHTKRPTLGDIAGGVLAGLLKKMGTGNETNDAASNSSGSASKADFNQANKLPPAQYNGTLRRPLKTILRRPKAVIDNPVKPRVHVPATPPEPKPVAVQPIYLDQRQREAAALVRATVAAAFPTADEERPQSVSSATRKQVATAIDTGAAILAARPEPDLDDGFIVGFDFGTSSVKLAVRQPYQAGDPVRALETPKCLQSLAQPHPNLWPSVIWFGPESGLFELVPSPGAIALDGFKSGLISGKGKEPANPSVEVSRAEACVAFLALQLAHLFGRYAIERPLGEVGGDHFLSINVGVPVHSMAQRDVVNAFAQVIAAALAVAPFAANLTHEIVRDALSLAKPEVPKGFALVPELTAAIAGYVAKPTARSGPHMLVDVGAATLDIVAFNLISRGQQVSVFASDVELFGASSMSWAKAAGVTNQTFKDACDHQFDNVFSEARAQDPVGFHQAHRREAVQLITTGGGCATELHSRFIAEMIHQGVLGAGVIEVPQAPQMISDFDCDRGRLLLAYGLTRDSGELAHCRLPSEIARWYPQQKNIPTAPSKDQM